MRLIFLDKEIKYESVMGEKGSILKSGTVGDVKYSWSQISFTNDIWWYHLCQESAGSIFLLI
jgi:hypothetical protein